MLEVMRSRIARLLLLLVPLCFAGDDHYTVLKKLYEERDWFRLREAVQSAKAPAFYRGVVGCAFNDLKLAERELQRTISSAPRSTQAYQAHNLLFYAYFRAGRYTEAQAQFEKMRSIRPENTSDRAGMALVSAINQHTGRMETLRRHSTVRCRVNGKIPVTINGRLADYAFDSGATISVISESEAVRLGMAIHEAGPQATGVLDARGAEAKFRIAVADHLAVGKTDLRHVVFFVFRDDQPPFFEMRQSERGCLGLQVMLALETVRWTSDGTVEIGFRSKGTAYRAPNLFLDGPSVIAEVTVQHRSMNVLLDTGSEETNLWPAFARKFPSMIDESGKKASNQVTGLTGSEEIDSVVLPGITLGVGGFETGLRPAHMLLKETYSEWLCARLGADLLGQARVVAMDFKAMTLSLSK
jgi:hypothetical protein